MKLNSNKLIAIVCMYLFVLSCSEHGDLAALKSDMVTIQIKSPDGNSSQTRAYLQGSSTSKALSTLWNEGEIVHVFGLQNGKLADLGEWPLTGVSSDGNTCNIDILLSGKINNSLPYEIFGVSNELSVKMQESNSVLCTYKSPTRLNYTPWTCSAIHIPYYFKGTGGGSNSISVQAQHLVAYEFTHITNNTKEPLMVNLKGYDAPKKWYYNKVNLTLPDCKVTGSNDGDIAESGGYEIDIDDTQAYFTCYLPNGEKPQGLQMNIAIDKKNEYKSSNLCNSNTLMQVGHAYHIRGVWDGEQLNFTKEIEEEPFDFELNDMPGEDLAEPSNDNPSEDIETFTVNGVSFNMVRVDGGTFMMGARDNENDAFENEKPQHIVTLNSFAIGQTEVTNALWQAVMSEGNSDDYPKTDMTYDDCQRFVNKLSTLTGYIFRLPTEAEWEFAARGGVKSEQYIYSGSDNIDEVAWYYGNSIEDGKHIVALKKPNELGIYDMSGNVSERCLDYYDENYYSISPQSNPQGPLNAPDYGFFSNDVIRVNRGGNWSYSYINCRSSARYSGAEEESGNYLGLRIVLETKETTDNLTLCPDNNHPHMIDLGYSNGILWACCNIGATKPEDYGGYYAWGETKEKEYYELDNYSLWQSGYYSMELKFIDIGDNITCTNYDVAHVKWGNGWRMPTNDESFSELVHDAIFQKITYNGVEGQLITGKNGNKLFFPFGGRYAGELEKNKDCGYYWTSTKHKNNHLEWAIDFDGIIVDDSGARSLRMENSPHCGLNVRAVIDKK